MVAFMKVTIKTKSSTVKIFIKKQKPWNNREFETTVLWTCVNITYSYQFEFSLSDILYTLVYLTTVSRA